MTFADRQHPIPAPVGQWLADMAGLVVDQADELVTQVNLAQRQVGTGDERAAARRAIASTSTRIMRLALALSRTSVEIEWGTPAEMLRTIEQASR